MVMRGRGAGTPLAMTYGMQVHGRWSPTLLAALLAEVLAAAPASASPLAFDPVGISVTAEDPPAQRSYALPALEILGMEIGMSIAARLYGSDWAQIDVGTMRDNVTGWPVIDDDPYTTDQFAHPWGGAMLFSAARSTGHGFWGSGLYTFGGSLVWEMLFESEPPSINDQVTTPFAGMLLGETIHRFRRALLSPAYGPPGFGRWIAASLVDPVAAANHAGWGDAWARSPTPSLYAHVGLGATRSTHAFGARAEPGQAHVQLVAEHGLTGDARFEPRRPLDHFVLRASFDASREDLDGTLYVRGLAVGAGFGSTGGRIRGVGGLFTGYDFSNEDRVRHSALGAGPGLTAQLRLGEASYVQGSAVGYLVPWGAAGGETEGEGPRRDYHHGPGLAGLVELALGHAEIGELRVTSRLYRIQGTFADDPADETVAAVTVGGRLHLARHHAIGVEADHGYRRADFDEGPDAGMHLTDRVSELRAFYAVTTNGLASGAP